MADYQKILSYIPHKAPFRFVDDFEYVDNNRAEGYYTFKEDEFFYKGHFPGYEVTPGVILTECMAQIGVLGIGLHTLLEKGEENVEGNKVFITSNKIDFLKPVFPGERVKVVGEKQYFRFSKIRVAVKAFNAKEEVVAKGEIDGVFMPVEKEKSFE